jgi:hypothetical protein
MISPVVNIYNADPMYLWFILGLFFVEAHVQLFNRAVDK